MTETVVGAWQIDPTRMAVRSRVERRREFGQTSAESRGSDVDSDVWRTLVSDGTVYDYPIELGVAASDPVIVGYGASVGRLQLPIEAIVAPGPPLSWVPAQVVTSTRFALTTPAGHFEDCGWFVTYGGSTAETVRAICPGVGYAETDLRYGGWSGIGHSVARLVEYHVVLPR